ncbi:MAG: pyrimidine dimer DNA glycosylase/endonuclease V [Candidatus Competibacter denitrificans]
MRLWSLHPQYLDAKGLVALWREGLLAQVVLNNLTKGYQHHPQLLRFRGCQNPVSQIAYYLSVVCDEASRRGYRFNQRKIGAIAQLEPMTVPCGQLAYEWRHLCAKLEIRAPTWLAQLPETQLPKPHPLFQQIAGGTAAWEIGAASAQHATPDHPAPPSFERNA